MAREILVPSLLTNAVAHATAEIKYAQLIDNPPSGIPFSEEATAISLARFAEEMQGQRLNEYMQSFTKDNCSGTYNFSLKPVPTRGPRTIENDLMGTYYLDGDLSLALGVDSQVMHGQKLWIAVASLCLGSKVEDYDPVTDHNTLKGSMPFRYPHPVIVQIQGPSLKNYGGRFGERPDPALYEEAKSVLGAHKWERAMIGLVLKWASEAQIRTVYMLPTEKNRWIEIHKCKQKDCPIGDDMKARKERLEMRYDATAKKLGFKLQPNGLYATSVI